MALPFIFPIPPHQISSAADNQITKSDVGHHKGCSVSMLVEFGVRHLFYFKAERG
jgi:hypothetical protein